ncbi:glutathione S-transferase family protein [Allosediminivita pacifica]|uniref:glutathione transferase n=1 Tax=Allosediminivita pacifica TaxID=1267769 RepID=A0A2T6AXB6_9RHOB|nr:glutathione S-transferase [Allosediminivita pacifica]PTX48438.1 glutathione S-transferase [Allosediminivita pacifica]GGB10495.1 glutathione S-transferase [Allosediminivita pacifica]
MIRVHYLDDSRAQRILWLLEELGQDYEVVTYHRRPDMRAPRALKDIHPLGKSPVIEHDNRVIAESGAITEYLLARFDPDHALHPTPGTDAALRHAYWLHYAEGSAMPLLVMKLVFSAMPARLPALLRPLGRKIAQGMDETFLDPQLKDHRAFWEAELERDGFFAGPAFTAADVMMSFPVEAGLSRIPGRTPTPALDKWLETMRARPAYQRALDRGGAYRYGKAK